MPQKLQEVLASFTPGKIEDGDDVKRIEDALMSCWAEIRNSSDTSMNALKLSGRMEDITWEPPLLSFIVERHGRTVNLSTRADLHRWTIDVSNNTAQWRPAGHRQIAPMAKRFNAAPVAEEIVSLILKGVDDPRLKWKEYGREVVVKIADVVPSGNSQQTEAARRKRFRKECEERLTQKGWEVVTYNRYRQSD